MHGLVIGRFQPLHKGHEALIKAAIEDCVDVTVGIGSSTAKPSVQDPFSLDERKAMIHAVFGDQVRIVAIPDIHDPPNYADHVFELTGPVDKVFGNDDRTLMLFEDAGVRVRRTGLQQRERFEGRQIRLQMAEGDGSWRKSVPTKVATWLEENDASKRIRLLEARTV